MASQALAFLLLFSQAAPPAADAILATYQGGTVTRDEYATWLLANGEQDDPEQRGRRLESIAFAEVLAAAAVAGGLDRRPEVAARLADLEREQLVAALRVQSDRSVVVDDAAVEKELLVEEPNRFKPRTVRLRNIFKRVPPGATAAEREAVRARMEDIRRRLSAGEDFDALAYRESDSQTRFQGGLMGYVPAGTLHPDVDRIAFALAEGELSPVFGSEAGFTLLRCDGIAPAREIPKDEARALIRQFRYNQGREARWEALRLELGGAAGGIDEARFAERAAERARLEGLDRDPALQARVRWGRARHLATQEMIRRVNAALVRPTEAELRAAYARDAAGLERPPEADVSVIQWRLAEQPAETFAAAESVLARIRAGSLTFEDAARAHSIHASAPAGGRLGFLPPAGLAGLGPNAFRVVGDLSPGAVSDVIQQDQLLRVVKLWARTPARPLTFEEAVGGLEKKIGDEKVTALRRDLEASLRRELRLVETPPAP